MIPGGNCFNPTCASAITSEIAPSIFAVGCRKTLITATPFNDCDSICSILLTLVVRERSKIETITSDAMEALARYEWPGNIRELQNFIERAAILTKGDVLQLSALPSRRAIAPGPVTLAEAERDHILNALRESNWVVGGAAGAAARLGVKRTTLISKMRKRGLSRAVGYGAV